MTGSASQRLGDRLLTEANADLLVVEGINWTGIPVDGFAHGRPALEPARHLPHTLVDSGELVYSAHFYGCTGPNHSGATGIGETTGPRCRDLSPAGLIDVLNRQAFFVTAEQDRYFTAPVWISEFGVGGREETGTAPRARFENFAGQMIRTDADFAHRPLVGRHENRRSDGWAPPHWDSEGRRMGVHDGDDWRAGAWTRLVEATGRSGRVAPVADWSMLSPDHADFVASRRMRALPDWDSGAQGRLPRRTAPPGPRPHRQPGPVLRRDHRTAVGSERRARSGQGRTERPARRLLGLWIHRAPVLRRPLPHRLQRPLGRRPGRPAREGRARRYDRHERPYGLVRPERQPGTLPKGGDFGRGHYKGQCADGEYAAGIAFTGRVGSSRTPDALYCREFD